MARTCTRSMCPAQRYLEYVVAVALKHIASGSKSYAMFPFCADVSSGCQPQCEAQGCCVSETLMALMWQCARAETGVMARRRRFRSYGSCSRADPVRWVDAQARYSTPSTSTNLTAMKCCCWGSYMGETMLRAWPGAPGRSDITPP